MSDFKMVENRKYNDEEIKYVVSRIHAGWTPEIIAKAFKRDHGEYWADREFTKKQVAYIRSTYKPPPGVVKPYTGPIPEFSRSPTPEDSPVATTTTGRKRKQAAAPAHHRSSRIQTPVSEQASSPVAGPSRKRQKTQSLMNTSTHQGNLNQVQGLTSSSPSAPLRFANDVVPLNYIPQEPVKDDSNTNASAGDPFAGTNYDIDAFEADRESSYLSLDPISPGMMGHDVSPAQGSNIPDNIPDLRNLLPDIPLQSIERQQSVATGAGTNATNSVLPTPQQQQFPQFGMPNPPPRFPPGCTQAGAVARDDPHGVWYFDPHDNCQIRLGHRHDMDGGVWFINELGVTQSLLAMRQTEGIGFLLGVATFAENILAQDGTRYLANNNNNNNGSNRVDPRALMRQATRVVHDNVPAEVLDRETFKVPEVNEVYRLSEANSRLPAGHFYDPFHRRVVQYDVSGPSETQGGGQGGGAAGSSRPSRQGTGPPGAAPF